MSTSAPGPIPHTTTVDEAMGVLSDDPVAYNLPAGTPAEQVEDRKRQAAQNLALGSRANAAYWDSRTELEQLVARAQGHGQVVAPPSDEEAPQAVTGAPDAAVVESSATDVPPPQVAAATTPGPDVTAPAEEPDSSAEDRLRAQLLAHGIDPEA